VRQTTSQASVAPVFWQGRLRALRWGEPRQPASAKAPAVRRSFSEGRSEAKAGWRELMAVVLGFGALTVVMTYPLAFRLGTIARVDNGDGQFSIWNVAWVARALVVDPLHVLDANIFYPHRWTLAYSETNLGAGALAVPVYWATGNPYAAHNAVLLLSFVLSGVGTYYLVRYLIGDRGAAAIAAIGFAFCPYVFAHIPHIQLLMTAGLPLSLLAFHRLADQPHARRGVVLGVTMATQAFFCGYYAVFVALIVCYGVVVLAVVRPLWRSISYWKAIAVAAGVAIAGAAPLFLLYASLQRTTGFGRSLDAARQFSADWRAYFASSAYAHAWILKLIEHWKEVLFPGFTLLVFGAIGVAVGWLGRGRSRELSLMYGGLAILAFWISLGPDAGLYRLLYDVPAFSLLRAPSRFGLIVVLGLSVLTGLSCSALFERLRRPALAAALLLGVLIAEHLAPLQFFPVPPVEPAYRVLAAQPYGAVLEMPVFSYQFRFARTRYMLGSTTHWMPLVDAYSDYIPQDFLEKADTLGGFPSRESFKLLERDRVRYAVFHVDLYGESLREPLVARLREFAPYLRQLFNDERVWLYEIVGFPP
jgi:hypothetical protein